MRLFTKLLFICLLSGLITSTFAASLDGLVTDGESGQPIADALVWAYQLNSNSTDDSTFYEAVTNESGHYNFEFLPEGLFKVTAHHPDYYESSAEVQSSNGEIALKLDFILNAKKHYYNNLVSGTISEFITGRPVPNVYIVLYTTSGDPNVITAISNSDGTYKFKNILPGTYNLIAFKQGYETFELNRELEIQHDTQIENLNFEMVHRPDIWIGMLTGYVFADQGIILTIDSLSQVRDMLIIPPPVYPAKVELFRLTDDNATYYRSTWTNPDGSYRIRDIIPGDYEVIVRARGYITHKEYLTIKPGYNEKIFFLKPRPDRFGIISGKVFFDESGEPVAGALINFINLSDRCYFKHTFTNNNGEYKAKLKPGRYVVSCSYLGHNLLDTLSVIDTLTAYCPTRCCYYKEYYDDVHSFAEAKRIPVRNGSIITGIDFGLPDYLGIKKFSVSGIVLREDGTAIAEAEVRIYIISCFNTLSINPNDTDVHRRYFTTKTNDDGTYSITIENKCWYVPFIIVSAHKKGFLPQFYDHKNAFYEADRIRIVKPEITDINFDLIHEPQTDFIMAGQITNPNNDPIPSAFIITGNINTGYLYFTFSNNDGFYSFNGLPRGIYYTLFIAFGYVPELWDNATHWADADPIYLNQDLFDINAELQPILSPAGNGTITGRINDQNGTNISGVLVTARNLNDQIVSYAFTDVNGDYNLTGLSGGEYSIEAGKMSYEATQSRIYVTPDEYETVVVDIQIEENTVTSVGYDNETIIPKSLYLGNNYPNPFNPSTKVTFGLVNPGWVELTVYNILGQRIKVLVDNYLPAGNYSAEWNGCDASGASVSSGLYLLMLKNGKERIVQKMVLAK